MKSYYDAHEAAYREIKSNGFVGWGNARSLDELGDTTTNNFLKTATAKFLGDSKNKTALDLGCGTGATAFVLAAQGFEVTGVDITRSRT